MSLAASVCRSLRATASAAPAPTTAAGATQLVPLPPAAPLPVFGRTGGQVWLAAVQTPGPPGVVVVGQHCRLSAHGFWVPVVHASPSPPPVGLQPTIGEAHFPSEQQRSGRPPQVLEFDALQGQPTVGRAGSLQ